MKKRDLSNRKYSIVPYDPTWPQWYETEATRLRTIFSSDALSIEHIGSTSIPNLAGKPTLDILVIVENLDVVSRHKPELEKLGYAYVLEYVDENSGLFFVEKENIRIINIHILPKGHHRVTQVLGMRDYLRTHPEDIKKYSDLKIDIFQRYPDSYAKYRELKTEFVNELETRALSRPMIGGIIFDFGDVLCYWKTDHLKDTAKKVIWNYLDASHEGTYHSIQDYFEKVELEAGADKNVILEIYNEMEASASVNRDMLALVAELKQRYKIALLSNFQKGIEEWISRFDIGHLFDAVISSYNIQKKKPSPDVYHYAADQIGLKPAECIFIDDSEKNVQAAQEVGMQGIIFINFDDCKKQLDNLLSRKF